ncbi:MAG TPA: PAS domain S-box protein [Burkholderiaceae bacterium]|nr:PAS domain S-box protein [Burkholderiaceae bacterium]
MTVNLEMAEGFSIASGALMAVLALLLWRHHPTRPAWGLRWFAVAMACGAVVDVLAPVLITGAFRDSSFDHASGAAGTLALMLGFGSLSALVVGIRCYVLRSPARPWLLFALVWCVSQLLAVVSVVAWKLTFVVDLIAAACFLYGAALSVAASRREPGMGHAWVALAFLGQPLALAVLALISVDPRAARYFAAVPYAAVGLVLLSASLVRLRNELVDELAARVRAEEGLSNARDALQRSHAVQQALLQQAPVPMAYSPLVEGRLTHTYWNQAWYRAFGHPVGSREGDLGSSFDFYVEPDTRGQYVAQVMAHGRAGPFDVRLKTSGGTERRCQVYGSLIDSDDGQFIVTTFIDVTEMHANHQRLREFETMVQSADDGIIVIHDGVILHINPAVERMFGREREQIVGRRPVELSPPRQPDGRPSADAAQGRIAAASAGEAQRFHWQHLRADGSVFTAQVALTGVEGVAGRVVAVLRDVTDEMANAQALARSEARFRSIITVANIGVWQYNHASKSMWCSPEIFTMVGLDPAAFAMDQHFYRRKHWMELVHPEDAQPSVDRFLAYLEGGSVGMYENQFRMRHADGRWVWILSRGQTIREEGGAPTDVTIGAHVDVSHIRQVQDDLRASRDQFQSLIENMPGTAFRCLYDADWTMLYLSANVDSITGYKADELIGNSSVSYGQLNHPDDNAAVGFEVAAAIEANRPWEVQYRVRHRDGAYRWVSEKGRAIRDEAGKVLYLDGFITDVTAKVQAEAELKNSQTLLQATFDLLPEPLAQIDAATGRYVDVNNMWVERLGIPRDEAIGKTTLELGLWMNSADRAAIRAKLEADGAIASLPVVYRHPSGMPIDCEVSATNMAFGDRRIGLWLTRDVTQKKAADRQLAKAHQMTEAIARAQMAFIVQKDRRLSFDGLLADILSLADSEYGFIGEVLHDRGGQPYLKTCAITNIAWNDETRRFYEANAPKGMEFNNLRTLFGAVMQTGQAVIANEPGRDPRRGGLPAGHPALDAFLGVPVHHGEELVGMFGVSNRPGGYDEALIDYLRPMTATIGQLIAAMRAQIRQQETELRLNSISNNLPNSMVYQLDCGEDGATRHFTYLSAGVEHLHGLSHAAVMADAGVLYAQIHPEDLPLLVAKEAACTATMSEFNTEYRGRGPDGTERWFYLSSTPSRNASNHIVWDGIELDITARKEIEKKLADLNQTLEARVSERTWELTTALNDLNRTQQELIQSEKLASLGSLVAGVAHELNTPIGNAVTVSSTLVDVNVRMREKVATGLTRSALNEYLDTIGEAGDMLTRNLMRAADLVTSFKQVAVDQANHQRREFKLEEILSEVQIVMAPALRKAHVTLQIDVRDNPTLDSYPGALSQALMILISNAVTHAFEGRESGRVSITACASGADRVQVVVADDGIGIAEASLGRIFEPFFTTKLGKGGSGLGLHICYNVVTGPLGGRLTAESTLGSGTRLLLDLPLAAPAVKADSTTLPSGAG